MMPKCLSVWRIKRERGRADAPEPLTERSDLPLGPARQLQTRGMAKCVKQTASLSLPLIPPNPSSFPFFPSLSPQLSIPFFKFTRTIHTCGVFFVKPNKKWMKYEDTERKCFPKSRFPNISMVKNFSPFLFSYLPERIYTSYKYLYFYFLKGEILLHFVVQSLSHLTTYTTKLNLFNLAMYQGISFWNRIYKSTPLSFLIAAYYFFVWVYHYLIAWADRFQFCLLKQCHTKHIHEYISYIHKWIYYIPLYEYTLHIVKVLFYDKFLKLLNQSRVGSKVKHILNFNRQG